MSLSVAPSPDSETNAPHRVMIVDDSAVSRGFFRRVLDSDPDIEIVASVGNGQAAIDSLRRRPVDVIVLDIGMPVMDGLTALPGLLAVDPSIRIIMASALTAANADISLKALSLGAADYIPKPTSAAAPHSVDAFRRELIDKVRALGRSRRRRPQAVSGPAQGSARAGSPAITAAVPVPLRQPSRLSPAALAIGGSTGGPQALLKVIQGLGNAFSLPVLVTQHMPATFTGILAAHIEKAAGREAREAVDGEAVRGGCVYVAPGDFHMLVERVGQVAVIRLSQAPPVNFCRPSVDPMLSSLSAVYGERLLTVILTGMGHDGLEGGRRVVDAGGSIIAQDEATSVVWGMPGAVAGAGLCSAVLPVDEIADKVRQLSGKAAA